MAPYSSVLACKIPWTEEPGRLLSMGLKELYMTERLSTHSIVDPTQFFSNLTRVTLYNLTLSLSLYI